MTSKSARSRNERTLRADALRNRIRILVAAEAVFASKGLDASTDEVARLAGVGIGTLYRHFATKDALVDAVFAGRMQRLAERAALMAQEPDAGRAFFAFFVGLVGEDDTEQTVGDALTRAGLDMEAAALRPDHPVHAALGHLLERAQRAGQVRPDFDLADLVGVMVGAVRAIRHAENKSRMRIRAVSVIVEGLRHPPHSLRLKSPAPPRKRRR